ncbi:toll/interleukin-1 receptor domain-containing protein [Streptomyces hokutonensis]|uniref:toll/interleukin-1 receptor domain-containing protein n=1 Tax=Streptomyces hokutonensis TaxID=1306990 RepID=UPI000C7F0BF3|nr:toll/interleukin-1 receptor domain-containing protein [Streptomyces hokutonensis]
MFISHSTSSDLQTARLRDVIADGLRERNYEVLLDVRVQQPGQPWQLKLAKFLGECDAALVLVNQAALDSSWVRRETNILHWRKTLHPSMVLVTVLVGEVNAGQLRGSSLGYLAADDVARVGRCSPEEATRIVGLFPQILQLVDDVVSAWLTNIGIQLREIRDPEVFARIARRLGVPPEEHDELIPGFAPVLLASQMLDTHDIEKLANAVFEAWMGGLDSDRAQKLATMVLPVWVDRDAARRIVQETDGSTRRVVILNVDSPLIGEQYLARAFCVDVTSYYIAKAAAGPAGEDDPETSLLYQCERAVKWAIGLEQDQDLDHPEEPRDSGRFFLVLDAKKCELGIVHRVVVQLHERIPWMHVLVIPGRGVNVRESWPGNPDEVLVLDPPFEAGHETLVQGVVRRVSDRLRPSDRGAW